MDISGTATVFEGSSWKKWKSSSQLVGLLVSNQTFNLKKFV